ncbi:MAG: nickel ABC transporter substrate-binding protein [Campylobacter sp.]|nr:nickel ABC transporter substrate-binding protein [Campylobacter sp.]
MLKKFLQILLFLTCFSLAFGDELKYATSKNVGPLNPHLYSPNEMFAQDMVYESLVDFEDNGTISPKLAISWKISSGGKVYDFKLRDGVKFSDGSEFDAKAVKANFDAILENRARHSWLELANIIKTCEVTGDMSVRLTLKNAYEPTLRELSLVRPFRFISPNSLIDGSSKDGIKAPIGTGPWMLVNTKLGVSDTFERNENYWGKKPHLKTIVAKVIPDPNAKVIALKTGEVDLVYGEGEIPQESVNSLKDEFTVEISEPINTLLLALNSNKFPTSDLSVRKALNLVLDKDLIAKAVFYDTQTKADFLFSKELPYCNINAQPYEFNLEKALNILENDGWQKGKDGVLYKDNKPLKLELVYIGSDAAFKLVGEILQAQAKKVGIDISLKADESTIFYKKQKTGDFHLIFNSTWGIPYDPVAFLASMRIPSHADYQAQLGMSDKALIDKKIGELLRAYDEEQKSSEISFILNRFHDEAIYIPISYQTIIAVANKKFGGVRTFKLKNHYPFSEIYLK